MLPDTSCNQILSRAKRIWCSYINLHFRISCHGSTVSELPMASTDITFYSGHIKLVTFHNTLTCITHLNKHSSPSADYKQLLWHQVESQNKTFESLARVMFGLKFVEGCCMVEEGMGQDAIQPPGYRLEIFQGIDGNLIKVWEIFGAAQHRASALECVQGIIDRRTFLWGLVSCAQKSPLLGRYHRRACCCCANLIQSYSEQSQFFGQLP